MNAHPCMNDRDTYAAQITPATPEAVTLGLFKRYPKIYYTKRIEILENRLKDKEIKLREYDDLAVAYDRIGRSDKAILVIQRKAKLLAATPAKSKLLDLDDYHPPGKLTPSEYMDYTTHANWGTFLIHDYFGSGRAASKLEQVREGIKHLEHAVRVNPDAHSGREWAQIDVAKWVYSETKKPTGKYPMFLRPAKETQAGLLGLVELGNAWESVDVFRMAALQGDPNALLNKLCLLRAKELERSGKKSVFDIPAQAPGFKDPILVSSFRSERLRADEWATLFQQAVTETVQEGLHPDVLTDGEGMGWPEPPMPTLNYSKRNVMKEFMTVWFPIILSVVVVLSAIFVIRKFVLWLRNRSQRPLLRD